MTIIYSTCCGKFITKEKVFKSKNILQTSKLKEVGNFACSGCRQKTTSKGTLPRVKKVSIHMIDLDVFWSLLSQRYLSNFEPSELQSAQDLQDAENCAAFLQENPNALEQLEKFRAENLNGLGLIRDEEAAKSFPKLTSKARAVYDLADFLRNQKRSTVILCKRTSLSNEATRFDSSLFN